MSISDHGQIWQEDGVGTNSGVTITKAAIAGQKHYATGVQCSGDAAATVVITQGSTVVYTKRFAAAFTLSESFVTPLVTATNALIKVVISASTSNCEANMQGYTAK